MADRIFPTTEQKEGLASEKEFNGINWAKFAESLDAGQKKESDKLPEGLQEILGNNIVDDQIREAKEEEEKEEKEKEKEEEKKGEEGEEEGEGKFPWSAMEKRARRLKVHFSSADQISAEAIEAAKKSGSEELVEVILAARKERRVRLANKILEDEKTLIKTAETEESNEPAKQEVVAESTEKGTQKMASKINKKVKISVSEGFKRVSSLNSAEKTAFAENAIANGFPAEYVAQMLGNVEETVSPDETHIKEVMASSMPIETKKIALGGMIKTAELDSSQKQRIIDYWIKDLQYGDEEWVRNWVNKSYK